jgi:hypothetical protein
VSANSTPIEVLPAGKYRAVLSGGSTLDFGSMAYDPGSGNITFYARQNPPAGITYNPYYYIGWGAYWPLPEIIPNTPVEQIRLSVYKPPKPAPVKPNCNGPIDPKDDGNVTIPGPGLSFIEGAGNGT